RVEEPVEVCPRHGPGDARRHLGRVEPQRRVVGPALPPLAPPVERAQTRQIVVAGGHGQVGAGRPPRLHLLPGRRAGVAERAQHHGPAGERVGGHPLLLAPRQELLGQGVAHGHSSVVTVSAPATTTATLRHAPTRNSRAIPPLHSSRASAHSNSETLTSSSIMATSTASATTTATISAAAVTVSTAPPPRACTAWRRPTTVRRGRPPRAPAVGGRTRRPV